MVPVKIKFSNLVRSSSPLQKSRQLNANNNDSLHNIIKYIPIINKKDYQTPLQSTLLKGSEGNEINDQKRIIKNGSFQSGNPVQKTIHRSLSNRKKKGIKRGSKKEVESTSKNGGFYTQLYDSDDTNPVQIKKLQLLPMNSMTSAQTVGDHETGESPPQVKVNQAFDKRFFLATTNQFMNGSNSSPKNREFSNISQPSTASTQQRTKINTPQSPHHKKFYQIYRQISQDSDGELKQGRNEYFIKGGNKKEKQEQQAITILKSGDKLYKTGDMFRQKSEMQKSDQDNQKQSNSYWMSNYLDSQLGSNAKLISENQQYKQVQSFEVKKKQEFPLIIKIEVPQLSPIKRVAQDLENQQTSTQQVSQQISPLGTQVKCKDILQDQQDKQANQVQGNVSKKRKSSVKLKKATKNKQNTQQDQNNSLPEQLQQYSSIMNLSQKNNIQLNKLMLLKQNHQLPHSARGSVLTPTGFNKGQSSTDSQDKIPQQPNIINSSENKQIFSSNSQQYYKTSYNSPLFNQSQEIQITKQTNVSNQQNNLTEKQSIEINNSQKQIGGPKDEFLVLKQSTDQSMKQMNISVSKSYMNSKERQGGIDNYNSIGNDIKNAQKIFYDLPPQYSNRIKFRKLSRVYFKPRNYFRGTNVAILHFDGVLGIYDNPFFNYLKSSDPQIPQVDELDDQLNSLGDEFKYKFIPQPVNNKSEEDFEFLNQPNLSQYPQFLGRSYFNKENNEIEQKQQDHENDSVRFKKEQLQIIQNLKQSLKKISQWYFIILILPQKSELWLEIRDYLISQHFFCDGIYTYDNNQYNYTSYYQRNANNIALKNPEFKIFNESTEILTKSNSKSDVLQGNKTFTTSMYKPHTDRLKQQVEKEIHLSFSGSTQQNSQGSQKDSDSNNNSFNINDQKSFLDLELLIDYNQILIDLKLNQPKKVLLVDTLPLNMRECFSKVEDKASFFQSDQKQEDLAHNIQILKLKEKVWRTLSLKFPKIKCHKSALRVVYLPSLHFEQKKFTNNSISFQSVLLEEIASEFQDDMSECRYINRNKQRWYYLNLNEIFSELENQKLKECFIKHMKTNQVDQLLKIPQASIYKQEQDQFFTSEQTIKQKIHKHFAQNNKVIEFLSKEIERQTQNNEPAQPQSQNTNQSSTNNPGIANGNDNKKRQSLGFQSYLNNLVENLISRNSKIIKQFQQNKETFQQAQQVQKTYSTFYDKNSHCTSKQQQQDKIEKELDLYIARKYKSSILFYFSNLQSSLSITLFFLFAILF